MNRRSLRSVTLVCLALGAVCHPASALDLGGHDRDGTVIGGNLGLARTEVEYFTPILNGTTDRKVDLCGGLSLGWADNDAMLTSLAAYGWKVSELNQGEEMTVTTYSLLGELTWFPGGEGFWLRGGFGIGFMKFALARPPYLEKFNETGWSWAGGLGYELRIQSNVAVGLAYDYRRIQVNPYQDLDRTGADSHCLTLNLRLY